ncbi:MAG: metallophosphoesterase family protein [Treponema sp.]|jgi:putative phosphoesterase|nr:metallophosphoesterase family protein [Treponema sp.]
MSVKKDSVLLVSDTHGCVEPLAAVFRWAAAQGLEQGLFLGDGLGDIDAAAERTGTSIAWQSVRGNMDDEGPLSVVAEFAGRRLYLAHGQGFQLDLGFDILAACARAAGAEAALFGHTHVPFFGFFDNMAFLNPGSVGRPRSRFGTSFAVLELPGTGPLSAEFWGISKTRSEYAIKPLVF